MACDMVSMENQLTQKTNIMDLNNDCLIHIFRNLDLCDLYDLRDLNNRFTHSTEHAYKEIETEKSLEFNYKLWIEEKRADNLIKILKYFGHCMTRVCIDECFTQFVKDKAIPQSFLSERLQNVRHLRLVDVHHVDEVAFISTLKNIEKLEVKDIDWMPFECRWSHLIELTVQMESWFHPTFDVNFVEKLMVFLLMHKHIHKLSIQIDVTCADYNFKDEEKLFEMIATNMHDLTELKLVNFLPNKNLKMIFMLDKLQKLELPTLDSIELLRNMKNLKNLSVFEEFRIWQLYDIVETVPTLTHLELYYDAASLDNEALEKLIEKRKLSPYCENELLRIENPLLDEDDLPEYLTRNEKYVSCLYRYIDLDSDDSDDESDVQDINIGGITLETFINRVQSLQ